MHLYIFGQELAFAREKNVVPQSIVFICLNKLKLKAAQIIYYI